MFFEKMMKEMFVAFSKNRLLNWFAIHCHILHPLSRSFVAGETIDEAVAVVKRLNQDGCAATIDILGESVVSPSLTSYSRYKKELLFFASPLKQRILRWFSLHENSPVAS